jgi:hypothetical protein
MSFRFLWSAAAIVLVTSVNAFGQGTYVSASVFGDIVRSTHTEYPGSIGQDGSGEALGFALRGGTPLGSVWGIEVEYARPGEIADESTPRVVPFAQQLLTFTTIGDFPGGTIYTAFPESVAPSILPYSVRTTQRNTTLSTALWFHQQLSARVAMVYLGGMGFYRSEHEYEYQYPFPRLAGPIPPSFVVLPPFHSETVAYGVRPLAGIEARIEMSEHAHLVAGVRLQASSGIWLVRPSVGLGWIF